MKLKALLLAAAATALASAAMAQTSTTSTTTSRTTAASAQAAPQTAPGAMSNTTSTTMTTEPTAGMNTTAEGAPPMSSGPFRPLQPSTSEDIVSLLKASGEFNTFLSIADATSLTQVLKTTPGITVFAPTDAAFAVLPPSALNLKDPANLQKLQKLLTYHIVNTKVPPLAGHSATPVTTVAGPKVTLDGSGAEVKINDATALQSQVAASNGVIYPIDKVLSPDFTPPAASASEAKTGTDQTTTTTSTKTTSRRHH